MIPLLTAAQVRELDRLAIEEVGIPGVVLMEAAGRALARDAEAMLPEPGPVAVVCGKGNNGGDGFVAARVLCDDGYLVTCFLMAAPGEYTGDAAVNLRVLQSMDVELFILPGLVSPELWDELDHSAEVGEALQELRERMDSVGDRPRPAGARHAEMSNPFVGASLVIDCLLGTGARGAPRDDYATVVDQLNDAGVPLLACDLPTGVDADTGEAHEPHVEADRTCSFAAWKAGLAVGPGAAACGDVTVHDIGIPRHVYAAVVRDTPQLAEAEDMAALVPARWADYHKGDAGRVVVIGGSPGFGGAPVMAATAALKAGAGLVTLALPDSLAAMLPTAPVEVMCRLLPAPDGHLTPDSLSPLEDLLVAADAVAVGPGLGTSDGAAELVRSLVGLATPLVVDADGLNLLAGHESWLGPDGLLVLTPHPGEAARMLSSTVAEVQANRLGACSALAERYGAVVVLKGHHTVVAADGCPALVIPTGTPAMAVGGMGDALTGVIAALLAQGVEPFSAGCLGAWLHGSAGELAAAGCDSGLLASELIAALPAARLALLELE